MKKGENGIDMVQKLKVAKQIKNKDFERLTDVILAEDKKLLEMLAKV